MRHHQYKKELFFDIKICDLSRTDLVEKIVNFATDGLKKRNYYVNLKALNIIFLCPKFRNIISKADIAFCDGFGVKLIAKLLRKPLRYRNTPPDWIDELAEKAIENGLSFYLLGDEDGVAEKAANLMNIRFPRLDIRGVHHGFFDKCGSENDNVIASINSVRPNLLLVGMGMPLQEFWIEDNANRLQVNAFLPLGAAFRWYTGIEKRAPKAITDYGLEWLARLISHPKRHFKRYIIDNLILCILISKWRFNKNYFSSKCYHEILPGCSNNCRHYRNKEF